MKFDELYRTVSSQASDSGKIRFLHRHIAELDEKIGFDNLQQLVQKITHGSDQVTIVAYCAPHLKKIEPNPWLMGVGLLCKAITHDSDKLAVLRHVCCAHNNSGGGVSCYLVATLICDFSFGSTQLEALHIICEEFDNFWGDKTQIINKFAFKSDADKARALFDVERALVDTEATNVTKRQRIEEPRSENSEAMSVSFGSNGMLINGLPVRGGPVHGSMTATNGRLIIDGQEYVQTGSEWVPKTSVASTSRNSNNSEILARPASSDGESSEESDNGRGSNKSNRVEPTTATSRAPAAAQPPSALYSLLELEGNAEKTEIESNQCVICLENKKTVVFHPCKHLCCCVESVRKRFETPTCPLCQVQIKSAETVFV